MPYDEALAARVRAALAAEDGIEERRMMGGLVFMADGTMLGGVDQDRLMVRVGPERHAEALEEPHVGPMDIGGRTPRGFVLVAPPGIATDSALSHWLMVGLTYARSLPPKPPRKPTTKT